MKRIFVDIYMAFNLGDDLFLDILARKYPNCEFTLNYVGNNYDEFISHYENLNRRKYTIFNKIGQRLNVIEYINNYERVAKEHDALIFIGGSIFREEDYHQSLYKDRMKLVKDFKDRNKAVFILGANFGPFMSEQFYIDYLEFFKQCDDVCFRDLYSYNLFKNLSQVRYAPDIVFQMNIERYKTSIIKNRVGFSIIDVRHKKGLSEYYDSYIESTVKSIELLTDKGYECYLMSFCEEEGDLEIINTIKSSLTTRTSEKIKIYDYKGNIDEAIRLIATFEMLVAARFHANIIALLLGIGLLPVVYSKKTSEMLGDIKMDKILINMNELHLQYDESTIKSSFNNKTDLASISNDAENQFKKLNEFLKYQSQYLERV